MKFQERFIRFMRGRNGQDEMARFLNGAGFIPLLLALVFTIISGFLAAKHPIGATVFQVLYWVFYLAGIGMISYSLFRIFSKNVYKRQAENTRFLYQKNKLQRKWNNLVEQWKNRKTYLYIDCPNCKQHLRVPRGKGKIRITCSKCGTQFIIKS